MAAAPPPSEPTPSSRNALRQWRLHRQRCGRAGPRSRVATGRRVPKARGCGRAGAARPREERAEEG